MAIYRFRVSFEDYDDIIREIDIKSNQTFEDLHYAIHKSTGYAPSQSSSFYVSNDQWLKGDEIAFLPSQRKVNAGIALMEKSKLSSFIDDPHQKFYYTYNFERPYDFHVELIKILLDDEKGKEYPSLFKSIGDAPKPASAGVPVAAAAPEGDDFDFLNDLEYAPEDADDLEEVDEVDDRAVAPADHEEEEEEDKDEFMDEFSDNEGYDKDDMHSKDDY
ncbi:IS1096 element passenger TnpR family protein [Hufsiella ginkgonis]|uniref:Plasmid pRiA4b Orf3-like domain-containing protein n=1 Tax=Hufsiella ginkgonis TaxID=2695274 RepID=A0A7K1Y3L2_9SPHI|nr:plasmid pRiA4b ORF-3 family protein [Hufsiella ginkgonis]MXV17850.1 hypothetical protein [Hufsiella ginkgonis]